MDQDLSQLRAEAEALAEDLAGLTLQVNAADALYPGAASRKKTGSGEQFWQYRRYVQTDAASRIDWRRSARTDDFFVRETELETARTILFWTDPEPGFAWRSTQDNPHKARRARTLMLSLGILLAQAGERIGVLGAARSPRSGKLASTRLAEDLITTSTHETDPPRGKSLIILASDFYGPVEELKGRINALSESCRQGVLLRVTDPIEHAFPFSGRTRFTRPGGGFSKLFGRAETLRERYLATFDAHTAELRAAATQAGWQFVTHRTDEDPVDAASRLLTASAELG